MKRKTIAIDIDDVLSASAEGFAAYSNERWGANISAEDYDEAWAVVWGVSIEEAIERSADFHSSKAVSAYRHFKEAVPVLKRLHERYDLVVITSRQSVLKPETDEWLERYFPGLFKAIRYAGIWDTEHDVYHKLKQTKTEICHEIGAQYLIDDQPKHCIAAIQAGIKAVLFGDYTWNRQADPGLVRARNWDEVEEYFNAQS